MEDGIRITKIRKSFLFIPVEAANLVISLLESASALRFSGVPSL
jgi:hypothetical protein